MSKLKVFKSRYDQELKDSIKDNTKFYLGYNDYALPNEENGTLTSNIEISDDVPILSASPDDDINDAIKVFEYLPIDETAASDPRLWSYLTHVTFKNYVSNRWPIANDDNIEKTTKKIEERWFTSGNARSLRRNAISRLWWGARLTVAPWEHDGYFDILEDADRYKYTRVLMEVEDLASAIVERPQLSSSSRLLIAVLEYLATEGETAKKRAFYREFLKEVILTLGYRKIMTLNLDELLSELNDIGLEVKRRQSLMQTS